MESRSATEANPVPNSARIRHAWERIRASPSWIVAIALLLRVGWIVIGHTYKFKSADDNFSFGWEMGRIAASLASGHGFSNPFGPATGPTAWEPLAVLCLERVRNLSRLTEAPDEDRLD